MKAAKKTRSGMVLVMVAGALAVMMILLLALLQSTSSQTGGAQSAAALAREKMLADSSVALVIGQIEQASTKTGQTWISQPGLLRTYDATATRKPTACYKLYSTPTLDGMLDTSGKLDFYTTDVPAAWNSEPSL
jgi:type II secretory pathway component PulK